MTGNVTALRRPNLEEEVRALHDKLDALSDLIQRVVLPTLPPREYLSIEEAARLTARSPQAVCGWCRTHRIGVKVGKAWRVDRAHLRRLLVDRFGEERLPVGLR
jgi:hypothetical protein